MLITYYLQNANRMNYSDLKFSSHQQLNLHKYTICLLNAYAVCLTITNHDNYHIGKEGIKVNGLKKKEIRNEIFSYY